MHRQALVMVLVMAFTGMTAWGITPRLMRSNAKDGHATSKNWSTSLKNVKAFELSHGQVLIARHSDSHGGALAQTARLVVHASLLISPRTNLSRFNRAAPAYLVSISENSTADPFGIGATSQERNRLYHRSEQELAIDDMPWHYDDHTKSALLNNGLGNQQVLFFGSNKPDEDKNKAASSHLKLDSSIFPQTTAGVLVFAGLMSLVVRRLRAS